MSALRLRRRRAKTQSGPLQLGHPNICSGSSGLAEPSRLSKLRATLRRHLRWHSAHACAGVVESNVPLVSGGTCGISRAVAFHFRPGSADRPTVNLPQEPAQKFATM